MAGLAGQHGFDFGDGVGIEPGEPPLPQAKAEPSDLSPLKSKSISGQIQTRRRSFGHLRKDDVKLLPPCA